MKQSKRMVLIMTSKNKVPEGQIIVDEKVYKEIRFFKDVMNCLLNDY